MVRKIMTAFYWIFDICITIAPFALLFLFRNDVRKFVVLGNYISFAAVYLAINAVAGKIIDKRMERAGKKMMLSKNWLIPMYVENTVSMGPLMMTMLFTVDALVRFSADISLCAYMLGSTIIQWSMIFGQVAWERCAIRSSVPDIVKYYACISNPLRIFFFEWIFCSSLVP